MPPALSNKGLATILSVVSGLAWAGPTVSGPYLSDAYGQVEFRTEGDEVTGTATGRGPCRFVPGTKVVVGELQGNVLVAHVLLCQVSGSGCEERPFHPALFVVNPQDRVLSTLIRLREGCTSPVLKDNALILKSTAPLKEARDGESEPESEPEAAPAPAASAPASPASASPASASPASASPAPAAEGAGSAALVAQARRREPEVPSLENGQRLLAAGNHAAAQTLFTHVLEKEPRNPAALVGLAASQLGLRDVSGALKTLESARSSSRPEIHFWLAYAYLRAGNRAQARDSLRRAIDRGWVPGSQPGEAMPERVLREELREDFDSLMQQRNRKRAAGREATGSGTPSP
jgi:hypothetical protein